MGTTRRWVLLVALGVPLAACGGAVKTEEAAGAGGSFGGGSGGSNTAGEGIHFDRGGAGASVATGAGGFSSGAAGEGIIASPPSDLPPDEPCAPPKPMTVEFSIDLDGDAGRKDGGAADSGAGDARAKVDAGGLSCWGRIPDYAPPNRFEPNRVNVQVGVGTSSVIAPYVGDRAACRPTIPMTFEWYYDDPVMPVRIEFCADTCEAFRRMGVDVVAVVLGCATRLVPPP